MQLWRGGSGWCGIELVDTDDEQGSHNRMYEVSIIVPSYCNVCTYMNIITLGECKC